MPRKIMLILITILFLAPGCNIIPLLKRDLPTDRTYFSQIIDLIMWGGFFEKKHQLIGHTIVFYTVDSLRNLVPHAPVLMVLNGDSTVVVSDSSAKIYVRISEKHWKKNGFLKAQAPDISVHFLCTASGYRNEKSEPSVVSLQNYQPLFRDNIAVFHAPGQQLLGQKYLNYLNIQRQSLQKMLGVSPTPFGIVLAVEQKPIHFFEPLYLKNNNQYRLFAYSTSSDSFPNLLLTNMHEWCEAEAAKLLKTDDPCVRWIQDGISELSRLVFAWEIPMEERERLGLQEELRQEVFKYYDFIHSESRKRTSLEFDLTQWTMAHYRKKVWGKEDMLGYPLSLYFWLRIHEKYNLSVISDFFQQASQMPDGKNQDYIRLLSGLTGEDIKHKLSNFPIADILQTLEQQAERLGIELTDNNER